MNATHVDLFSGIGGFALAAREAGFNTIGFCEADERCRGFLERSWGLPVAPDIRQFDARLFRGISLLTGGPPCQPASRAGKQGGERDDRWLWPEALRVLEEAKPDCVVFENPPGILDVGIDGILSEMGRVGYEVQPFDIPACAVDSPQLRHRIWFVGFARGERSERERESGIVAGESGQTESEAQQRERRGNATGGAGENGCMADTGRERSGQDEQGRRPDRRAVDRRDCADELADAEEAGRKGHGRRRMGDGARRRQEQDGPASSRFESDTVANADGRRLKEISQQNREQIKPEQQTSRRNDTYGCDWKRFVWVPCADGKLRRAPDDSFDLVNGLHSSLLAALGNSICWQVAVPILKAAREQIA